MEPLRDDRTPHGDYLRTRTFASLDGVRFLAITAVVFFHSAHAETPFTAFNTVINRGFLGVDLFFVLSGFLIVTLLLREQGTTGTIRIGQFYRRRALRILPPWALLLGVLALVYGLVNPGSVEARRYFEALPFNLTFTSNWVQAAGITGILWSLSTEEQFYLVWPLVQRYLGPRTIAVLLVLVIAVNQLFNFGIFRDAHDSLKVLQTTFTPMALGALLANLLHRPRGFAVVFPWTGFRGAPVVTLLVMVVLMAWPNDDISGLHRLAIQAAMTVFLASCVVREPHALRGALGWKPVARLGKVSYGVYLYHLVALALVNAGMARLGVDVGAVTAVLTLGLAFLFAEVSYRFWETPFLKLKDRTPAAGPT